MATFTCPAEIADQLQQIIHDALLARAKEALRVTLALIAQETPNNWALYQAAGPFVRVDNAGWVHKPKYQATLNAVRISLAARDQRDHAVKLLENRVAKNLAATDTLTSVGLYIRPDARLIEGNAHGHTADGQAFHVSIRMLWNYRYGENAANGVLNIYPQFRGNRFGAPLEGKPSLSAHQAAQEVAKADREATKAARQATLLEKFRKAPERLARQMDKAISEWGASHPTAPDWQRIAAAARALTEAELQELFAQGCRTSGDLESKLRKNNAIAWIS